MNEQNNILQLKKLALKITSATDISQVKGTTIADVISYIETNLSIGGGSGGKSITQFALYPNEEEIIKGGEIFFNDGTSIHATFIEPDELTLTSANGSAVGQTVVTVSPALGSGNHYRIFVQSGAISRPAKYENVSDWNAWDGVSEISATKGNYLAVAECDENDLLLKFGTVKVVAPLV